MKIILNGKDFPTDEITVSQLVASLKLDTRRIAIECNLSIVPRSEYQSTKLNNGDRVEIVSFIGGG